MMEHNIEQWAKEVSHTNGFNIKEEIYTGYYYSKNKVRNIIYSGTYGGKDAVLKLYNDPRLTDEPVAIQEFHESNKSTIIKAPKLYASAQVTPHMGWMIMEKLPEGGNFFAPRLDAQDRKELLYVFGEYRKHFPRKPQRPLILIEHLPAHEDRLFDINSWLRLATIKDAELIVAEKLPAINSNEFIPRYLKALKIIREEFSKRKMVWCHGHFKPREIYKVSNDNYYIIDFAHRRLYPEGYEFSHLVWADLLAPIRPDEDYEQWRDAVFSWISDFSPIAEELGWLNFESLARASLIERILGTILADIGATDDSHDSKVARIAHLYRLLDELIEYFEN